MKTKKDFTATELEDLKKENYWYYEQIINNAADYFLEGGYIKDRNSDYKIVAITSESLRTAIEQLRSPKFAYTRAKNYGIAIYHKDNDSPTGVINVGGISSEFSWLVDLFSKGTLSPTEDLRTAI